MNPKRKIKQQSAYLRRQVDCRESKKQEEKTKTGGAYSGSPTQTRWCQVKLQRQAKVEIERMQRKEFARVKADLKRLLAPLWC